MRRRTLIATGLLFLAATAYLALAVPARSPLPFTAVASDSMAPALHRGDLVYLRSVDAADIRAGDVIAFDMPRGLQTQYGYPGRIIHRVTAIEDTGADLRFQTKGDNTLPDPFAVGRKYVKGRYQWSLPGLGYGLLYLQSRQGQLFLLAGLAALLACEYGGAVRHGIRSARGVAPPSADRAGVVPVESSGTVPPAVQTALDGFAASMQQYATHLQSHTAVMMNLREVTESLEKAVQTQARILEHLEQALIAATEKGREERGE